MPKKDYKRVTDGEVKKLKADPIMRDLDLRNSAQEAGDYFHMVADRITEQPDSWAAKLFQAADLNHQHPFAWDYLLTALAEIHFKRQKGAPVIQDDDFKRELQARVKKIVEGRRKAPNQNQLARLLLDRHGEDYPTVGKISGFNSLLRRHGIEGAAKSKPRAKHRQLPIK
jgi:hypothetical protein